MDLDKRWMARAIELARRGTGRVHPNPLVGCVIVRGSRLIAEGYHHGFGKDHAEIDALKKAGARARGATLYVNLEPCAHWGKTPPCVAAVAGSQLRRVIAAMRDPNPQVSGKGFAFLRKHRVQVSEGLLRQEAAELNRAFIVWIRERRPFVTLKAAVSLDGKIATAQGESRWITGPQARRRGHALRAEADAIAVGINTVLHDDPSLTAHGRGRDPKRVIFDSRLRTPLKARALRGAAPTWIFTTPGAPAARRKSLERKAAVYVVPSDAHGRVSLPEAARVLAREGIAHLLVEGGGALHAGFLESGLADEAAWFIAPKIIGGETAKTAVEGEGVARLADAAILTDVKVETLGQDICVTGKLR